MLFDRESTTSTERSTFTTLKLFYTSTCGRVSRRDLLGTRSERYKKVSLHTGSNKRSRSGSILLPTRYCAKLRRSNPYYTELGQDHKMGICPNHGGETGKIPQKFPGVRNSSHPGMDETLSSSARYRGCTGRWCGRWRRSRSWRCSPAFCGPRPCDPHSRGPCGCARRCTPPHPAGP